jgi:hypothetical protein
VNLDPLWNGRWPAQSPTDDDERHDDGEFDHRPLRFLML